MKKKKRIKKSKVKFVSVNFAKKYFRESGTKLVDNGDKYNTGNTCGMLFRGPAQ